MKIEYVTLAGAASRDWIIGLLNSLSRHAPGSRLKVIPFDQHAAALSDLCRRFPMDLWSSPHLHALDKLGARLGKGRCNPGYYRKFASFGLQADVIVYLDTDVVLNEPLDGVIRRFLAGPFEFVYQEVKLDMACAPGPERDRLVAERGFVGFNSGFYIARGGLCDPGELERHASEAESLGHCLEWLDQGFMNLVASIEKWRMVSLSQLEPEFSRENWAYYKYTLTHGGYEVQTDRELYRCESVPLMHWAGFKRERSLPNLSWFLRYRFLHLPPPLRPLAALMWRLSNFAARLWLPFRRRLAGVVRRLGGASIVEALRSKRTW